MKRVEILVAAAIVLFLGLAVRAAVEEGKRWKRFVVEHHCKVVAHISGDVFNTVGFGSNGQMVVGVGSTPDKEGWLCDDGKTYFR